MQMTKEEFKRLGDEWLAAERTANDPISPEECRAAITRCLEIERLMEEAPFEWDEKTGEIIERKEDALR